MVKPAELEAVPSFLMTNFVVPEEDAANMSSVVPTRFNINPAFEPMPPLTLKSAGVLEEEPILTPVLKSDVMIKLPVPLGVIVKSVLTPVVTRGAALPKVVVAPFTVSPPPKVVVPEPVRMGPLPTVFKLMVPEPAVMRISAFDAV